MKWLWKGPGCLKKARRKAGDPVRKDDFIYPGEEVKEGDVSGERIDQLVATGQIIPAPVESEADEPEAQPEAPAAGPKKSKRRR